VVGVAFGALVDDLVGDVVRPILWVFEGKGGGWLTMALTELPLGPVTETQAPHSAALSHRGEPRAVPKRLDGRV
jgi:hypothetical protein